MAVRLKIFGQEIGGAKRARSTLDAIVEEQQNDAELRGVMDDAWAGSKPRMSTAELENYSAALLSRASSVKAVNAGAEIFQRRQSELLEAAGTEENREQLRSLDGMAETARGFMLSGDAKLEQLGREMFKSAYDKQDAYGVQNEAQAIAGKATLGADRWSRFQGAYDDLYRESTGFLEIQRSHGVLRSVYTGDGDVGNVHDVAAINSLQRMIDPGATVRDGDIALIQNYAGVPDWLLTAANRVVKGGGRLTPEERAGIVALGDRIMSAANEKQSLTNVRFQGLGEVAELPDNFIEKLKIPLSDTGQGIGGGLNFGVATPMLEEGAENVPRALGERVREGVETGVRGFTNYVEGFLGIGGGDRATDEYDAPTAGDARPGNERRGRGSVSGRIQR